VSDVGVIVSLDDTDVEQQAKAILDYTSRDFVAIRAQLVGLAQGLFPEWETAGEAPDFGTLLLELFAYMGDVMHYYIDRTASEAFLGTAVRRQSVLYIADMLGYNPVGQQAASVVLNFTLQPDDVNAPGTVVPVKIPQGTKVYNSSSDADAVVVFELVSDVNLNPGDSNIQAYADEGISVQGVTMGVAQGIPNTEFVIMDMGVIYGTIEVYTQEGGVTVRWTYVTHLADARPTQAVFTTFMDDGGLTHIVFGDNTAGRIPPVNAYMFCNYRYGVGAAANRLGANTIDTISDVPNVDLYYTSVTNPDSPVGGSDPESIDSMRYSVSRGGRVIKDRAVTLNDFADLAMQVPGVAKSVAYGTVYTAVWVRIAPVDGQGNTDYMDRLCTEVEAYLSDKVLVGSSVNVEPTDISILWQDIYIRILVHVVDAYNRTSVRLQVEAVVRSLIAFDHVDFGTRISIGLIYRAVLAVAGVEYAELQWLSTEAPPNEQAFPMARRIAPLGTVTSLLLNSTWGYDVEVVMADPGTGDMRLNATSNPTLMAISVTDDGGTVQTSILTTVRAGDHIVFSQTLDQTKWISMVVTGAIVNNTTWIQIPVVQVAIAPNFPSTNENVDIGFVRYAPTPTTPTGDVQDIATDELLIPRIEPTEVIEDSADFPNMTEDERTHDGLWVKAVGGSPNT